ncbi:putative membrane protein [plant metagenome]
MAVIFLVAGVRKLINYTATAGYFGTIGIPLPDLVLPLTILLELGGAVALIIGWRTAWVAGVLGLFCIGAGLLGHRFWAVDAPQFANQLNHFLKNVAMAGGFLAIAAMSLDRRKD